MSAVTLLHLPGQHILCFRFYWPLFVYPGFTRQPETRCDPLSSTTPFFEFSQFVENFFTADIKPRRQFNRKSLRPSLSVHAILFPLNLPIKLLRSVLANCLTPQPLLKEMTPSYSPFMDMRSITRLPRSVFIAAWLSEICQHPTLSNDAVLRSTI